MALAESIHVNLLWLAVAWPLLLALPWMRIHDSRLGYLAVLPAAVLAVWPGQAALALPRLMLSTGLAVEAQTRWILGMSVSVWLAAASLRQVRRKDSLPGHDRTFFLLTLAGNIGAVLATDIVGFFLFSVLMGYSFYGLFGGGADATLRRAGRVYLVFLVFADQFLFEAMLIAAKGAPDLGFEAVRQAVAGGDHAQMYTLFALIGFGIKAGLWPSHWWVPSAYRSASRPAVLLAGVPVAMALLGAVRWLPLGQLSDAGLGIAFEVLGLGAAVYGAQSLARFAAARSIPAWGTIIGTGLFFALLGRLLAVPALWQSYGDLARIYIASLGFFAMVLTVALGAAPGRPPQPVPESTDDIASYPGRWSLALREWSEDKVLLGRSGLNARLTNAIERWRHLVRGKRLRTGWGAALAAFVLIGFLLAWLAI